MDKLTDTQKLVLDYLKDNQSAPTLDRVREYFGWRSINAAAVHMHALARKGYISKNKGRWEINE